MKKLLILSILVLCGCINQPSGRQNDTGKNVPLSLQTYHGHWLIKPYFDSLNMDPFRGRLNTSDYGFTEIIIDSAHRDSVWLLNEDLEKVQVPVGITTGDSIQVRLTEKTSTWLVYNPGQGTLLLKIDERSRQNAYFCAPDSLISPGYPESSFRKALNCWLARHSYIAYDPLLDAPHGVKVRFDCNGNVYGMKNFKSFHIYVNGDMANCQGMDRIDLFDGQRTHSYGMVMVKSGVNLYHLVLMTKPGEKPWYRKGEFFLDLQYSH